MCMWRSKTLNAEAQSTQSAAENKKLNFEFLRLVFLCVLCASAVNDLECVLNHSVKHQHINLIAHCKITLRMVQHHQPIGLSH